MLSKQKRVTYIDVSYDFNEKKYSIPINLEYTPSNVIVYREDTNMKFSFDLNKDTIISTGFDMDRVLDITNITLSNTSIKFEVLFDNVSGDPKIYKIIAIE